MKEHNYTRKLARMVETGEIKRGQVRLVDVAHDDWCGIYKGRHCNCEPDIRVRDEGNAKKAN